MDDDLRIRCSACHRLVEPSRVGPCRSYTCECGHVWASPSPEAVETTAGDVRIYEGALVCNDYIHRVLFGVAGKQSVQALGAGLPSEADELRKRAQAARLEWLRCVATLAALDRADGHDAGGLTFPTREQALAAGNDAADACRLEIMSEVTRLLTSGEPADDPT